MKKSKLLIGLLICVTIYVLLVFIFFKNNNSSEADSLYLVLDNYGNYQYNNGEFKEIPVSKIEDDKKAFDTYIDNSYYGSYHLKYGNIWNLFDSKSEYQYYQGYLFAVSDGDKVNVNPDNARVINEDEKNMLKNEYNITNFDNLVVQKVYDIDLDMDNKKDKLLCISNYDSDDYSNKNYNLVIAIINSKKYNIINEKGKNINNIYDIKGIFTIDKKDRYFIIEKDENPNGDIESNKIYNYIYCYDS